MKRKILYIVPLCLLLVLSLVINKNRSTEIVYDNTIETNIKDASGTTKEVIFCRNYPGDNLANNEGCVKKYYSQDGVPTFVPYKWGQKGKVLAGWSTDSKANAKIDMPLNGKPELKNLKSKYYAKWVPLNQKYGNVVFIGDSYISSSEWPDRVAERLGIGSAQYGGSYTYFNMPGTGFLNQQDAPGDYKEWLTSKIDFSSLLALADRAIAYPNDVKLVVVVGGYNDINNSSTRIVQAIRLFNQALQRRFPNAKLAIGMAGTDFLIQSNEMKLITDVAAGYKAGVKDYNGLYLTANNYSNLSLSEVLMNYALYHGNSGYSYKYGCYKKDDGKYYTFVNNKPTNIIASESFCKYLIEPDSSHNFYVLNGYAGIHPTKSGGDVIAERIANQLKTYVR